MKKMVNRNTLKGIKIVILCITIVVISILSVINYYNMKNNSQIIITSNAFLTASTTTPEEYGAKGDGITDDTEAIQQAVNSGASTIILDDTKTYLVTSQIEITDKTDLTIQGGKIYAKSNSIDYNVFWITGSSNCTFENIYVYSNFDKISRTTPQGHSRPGDIVDSSGNITTNNAKSSNVRVFAGVKNNSITFKNNKFESVDSDYWFNGNDSSGGWNDIIIDGWTSNNSIMPMFGQMITGLIIKNANVNISANYAGNGDHCIYISYKSSDITIRDSYFTWNGKVSVSGAISLFTFHSGTGGYTEETKYVQPTGVKIINTVIDAKEGRAIWSASPESIDIDNCNITSTNETNVCLLGGGNSIYNIYNNSTITSVGYVFDSNESVFLNNSTITGEYIFNKVSNVEATDCIFNIDGGFLDYSTENSSINHKYTNCTIKKNEPLIKSYIVSKRTTSGSIYFDSCDIDCGTAMFMYNGGVPMNGITLYKTQISNASSLANTTESSNYTSIDSYLNGILIPNSENNTSQEVNSIKLSDSSISLTVGEESKQLNYVLIPSNGEYDKIFWSSSSEEIAIVDSVGNITARKAGTAIITVKVITSNNEYSDHCVVTVSDNSNTDQTDSYIKLNTSTLSMNINDTIDISTIILSSSDNVDDLRIESSNTSVVEIKNTTLIAKSVGSSNITFTTADGKNNAVLSVTVSSENQDIVLEEISLNINEITINIGESFHINSGEAFTIIASLSPEGATNKLTWTSSDTSIATVVDGMVTTKKTGKAKITVTAENSSVFTYLILDVVDKNNSDDDSTDISDNTPNDKAASTCEPYISYTTTNETTSPVGVVLNFKGNDCTAKTTTYTFFKNGSYTFSYQDKEGNTGSIVAKVTWIKDGVTNSNEEIDNPQTGINPKLTISLLLTTGLLTYILRNKSVCSHI